MKNRFLALITPVILLIGAIVFIGLGILNLQQVKKFPEIQATVTKVEQELDTAGDSSDVNETVWVHYTVDERDYDEVLQFHEVDKLKVGDTITVRYGHHHGPLQPRKTELRDRGQDLDGHHLHRPRRALRHRRPRHAGPHHPQPLNQNRQPPKPKVQKTSALR